MKAKSGVRSGVVVAILAQCAVLAACGPDAEGDPPLDGGDGTGGAPLGGDGDGNTGGVPPVGDGDGDAPANTGGDDSCEDLALILPIDVQVRGGWDEAQEQCRATVALKFEGKAHELSCSGSESDCVCGLSSGVNLPREGVALTVTDGETVLHEQGDLEDAGACEVSFGAFEVDYIEALRKAVASLSGAADDLVSPVPCETADDCEAIPLGAKACGGPQSYAVVSNLSETYGEFVTLADELERIEGIYNEVAEVTSDCAYEVAPEVACATDLPSRGMCVAGTPL